MLMRNLQRFILSSIFQKEKQHPSRLRQFVQTLRSIPGTEPQYRTSEITDSRRSVPEKSDNLRNATAFYSFFC